MWRQESFVPPQTSRFPQERTGPGPPSLSGHPEYARKINHRALNRKCDEARTRFRARVRIRARHCGILWTFSYLLPCA